MCANKIKVSVIVPVYNVQKYLCACIDSVLQQTLSDIEVICVNDGSTDDSRSLLSKYEQSDSRVHIIDKDNGGLSSARNAGLDVALGKYVYMLDSDDYVSKDVLKQCYDFAEANNLEMLFFNGQPFLDPDFLQDTNADGSKSDSAIATEADSNIPESDRTYSIRSGADYPVLPGQILLAEMVKKNDYRASIPIQFLNNDFIKRTGLKFIDGIIHEDEPFTFAALLQAKSAAFLNQTLFYRRVRAGSIMKNAISENNVFGYFIGLLAMFDNLAKIEALDNSVNEAIQICCRDIWWLCICRYREINDSQRESLLERLNTKQRTLFSFLIANDSKLALERDEYHDAYHNEKLAKEKEIKRCEDFNALTTYQKLRASLRKPTL
ncbi:MAG: glycosyltransferase [Coriobacteriales bacterium]|jgi:glycosyltransferase involved in cell wall biosynthesis|nr:glycosyltransferase [Coriobacteriales bacterium]